MAFGGLLAGLAVAALLSRRVCALAPAVASDLGRFG
jgi:hypothetical protein